jgi:hypothetical protein
MTWTLSRRGATLAMEVRWPRKLSSATGEQALLQVEGQAVGGEDREKHPQVFPVLLIGLAVHTVII